MLNVDKLFQEVPKLVDVLQHSVKAVADHCWSRKIISKETYSDILQLNKSNSDRTRQLLLNIYSNMTSNPEVLETFCDILVQIGGFDELVLSLKAT